jgi:ADP-heptose:LPS heptosyltransferase
LTKEGDFDETAKIIKQLDLVITIDSAVAHLAGALGVPCWVILPYHGSDWRWGVYGSKTTHLYNNMELFWKTGVKPESVTTTIAEQLAYYVTTLP